MKGNFYKKLARRNPEIRKENDLPPGPCKCWECIRADGLTPPRNKRTDHASLHPYAVYGKDAGGEPIITHGTRIREQDEAGSTPEEKRHLREAVRNREAI